jgi:hypothetical protein
MVNRRSAPYEFIRVVVMLATLASLALICVYLIFSAFNSGSAAGLRSAAGILLPLVVGGFVAVFNRGLLERFASVPVPVAFLVSLVFGVAVMVLIEHLDALRFAPIPELIISAGLSVLLYAPGALPGFMNADEGSDKWVAYYFGIVSGMLGYVVFMGFPFAQAA